MNRHGSSSEGGGSARDVELERCCLAGTDFLGAMVVNFDSQSAKIRNQTQTGDERAQENLLKGKLDGRGGIYRCSKCVPLRRDEGSYVTARPRYSTADCTSLRWARIFGRSHASAKGSSLLRTRGLA